MATLLRDARFDVTDLDAVGRAVALAHILHLDRRPDEALRALDRVLSARTYKLPEEIRLVIEQNRVDVCFGRGLPVSDDVERRHSQIDRQRLLGVTFGRPEAILDAEVASQQGKNYDSLPTYNALLFDAYRRFDWLGIRQGAERLCRELVILNEPIQATFCAVLSESHEAAELLADRLRAINDSSVLCSVLEKLTETAHLSRHITLACHFIEKLDDAVPDRFTSIWLDRLRPIRRLAAKTMAEGWATDPAWKATAVLLPGGTVRQVHATIDEVLRHRRWAQNSIARLPLYKVLDAAASIASKTACKAVTKAVIPHVIAKSPGPDFRDALRLLLKIADRWPGLKVEIRRKLYRRGRGLPHLLASAAPFFEQRVRLRSVKNAVQNAIKHLEFQVERLGLWPGEKPATGYGEVAIQTKNTQSGTIAVKIGSCAEELGVLVQYRSRLGPGLVRELVNAIIKTLSEPENDNNNRTILFDVLRGFSEVMDHITAREVIKFALTYAGDHRLTTHPLHGQPEQHAPLNPFRFETAWPQQVRGKALLALAQLSREHPRLVGPELARSIFAAIADRDPAVRRNGYHAILVAGSLAKPCLLALVGGIRDSDATAANVALQVVGLEASAIAKAGLAPTVLSFVAAQCRHPDVGVRNASAVAVRRLQRIIRLLGSDDVQRLKTLHDALRVDVSRQVRASLLNESDDGDERPRRRSERHVKWKGTSPAQTRRTRKQERQLTITAIK